MARRVAFVADSRHPHPGSAALCFVVAHVTAAWQPAGTRLNHNLSYIYRPGLEGSGCIRHLMQERYSLEQTQQRPFGVNDHAHQHHRLEDDGRHLTDPTDGRVLLVDVALDVGVRDDRLRAADV